MQVTETDWIMHITLQDSQQITNKRTADQKAEACAGCYNHGWYNWAI